MEAIIKNENVYVVVKNMDVREGVNLEDSENLIMLNKRFQKNLLYGGRVVLRNGSYNHSSYYMEIDGITIARYRIVNEMNVMSNSDLSLEQIVSFLNQIENLGLDPFIDNYKLQLQNLKNEIEVQVQNMQNDLSMNYDEKRAKMLDNLRRGLLDLSFFVCTLLINMNAGLSNQHYIDAYDAVVNMYF